MVSLKDVAALSGVSPATVSRAINNPGMVDPETRKTIQAAMKKLNYRPNLVASGLRTRNSRQIALIVPDRPLQIGTAKISSTPSAFNCSKHSWIRPNAGSDVAMTFCS